MSFRIREEKFLTNTLAGEVEVVSYVVEVEKVVRHLLFFTKKVWKPFITPLGFPEQAWAFSSKEVAMERLQFKIKCDTIVNSK